MKTQFDIVIYGATGFTGQLATKYLTRHRLFDHLRIAIAGRNQNKLEVLQKSCERKPAILLADSTDLSSIEEMVQQTKVVLSFAGPFVLYGEPIIAACAKFGVDYLDITGEIPFIRSMIERYQKQAKETGARLIPFSGFDSIPADLSVYLGLTTAREKNFMIDEMCFYYQIKGGFNGGTLASALNMAEHPSKHLLNANSLIPVEPFAKSKSNFKPQFEPSLSRWSVPFFMAPINKAVVARSNWLRAQENNYHHSFKYEERLLMSKRNGFFNAICATMMLGMFRLLSANSLGRKLIQFLGPKPGEGPSEKARREGFFRGQLHCRHKGISNFIVKMEFKGDPGNATTVALACESARLAAENSFLSNVTGFLTPTTAFGNKLLEQLRAAGFRVETEIVADKF